MAKEKKQDSGWQFPKALEIVKCKEGNKEFMKERPARRPFGNTVLICEYPLDGDAMQEPNARMITWRLAKRAARDFLRVSFMTSAIVTAAKADKPVEREAISIAYSGKTLKPLQTRRGLVFIESRYLSPVSDILDVLELYERITPRGTPYIVAKAGFLLQAVITPYDVISQQFVDNLKRLTEQCVLSLDLRDREKALAHAAEPEQYSLNVDPATGEIVEGESEVADNE